MEIVERVARAELIREGVDPDHICVGLGIMIPLGAEMPAWQVRAVSTEAALREVGLIP